LADAPVVDAALMRFRQSARVSPAFGLGHIQAALAAFGDPQDAIPPAIHVTGTNGKGSTCAFIRSAAESAGLKVHVFTSPHLVRVNERIRLAGRVVDDEILAATLHEVAERSRDLTYFEALTAAAFILFAQTPADLSLIEVGAGGATDATNVMARSAVSVATPISLDHEAMFGVCGVRAIAELKAGIFREGAPAVIARQTPEALETLLREAARIGARPLRWGREWSAGWDEQGFVYESDGLTVRAPRLGLQGRRQAENAGAALAALDAFGHPSVTPEAMAQGLQNVVWPARLQKLRPGPLTARTQAEIWVDAAHNPGGAEMLAETIRDVRARGAAERVALVAAMQTSKDAAGVLAPFAGVVDRLATCRLPDSGGQEGGEGADPGRLAEVARAHGLHADAAGDFWDALRLAAASGADRIYVAGSLYLAGAVLDANGEQIS
jgi:dihydrofolate synthase / folylpolyglutamate synthase